MTSAYQPPPDVTGYTDLRIFDRTEQQIFDNALQMLRVNLPELTPREGHTEVRLLESGAIEAAEMIVAANRLPGALLETLLRIMSIYKDYGVAATADATVVCADSMGHQIPAGTRMVVAGNDGTAIVMLVRPPGVDIPPGSTSGPVSLISELYTDLANGVPAGTALGLVSPLPFIDSITLTTPVTGGRDPESDDDWRDRGVNRLSRLTDVLILPRHFLAAAMEAAPVARAVVVDNTDPGVAGTGNTPGHVTVAVLGDGGAAVATADKNDLQATLQDAAYSQLVVHVVDVTVTTLTIAVQVHLTDATDPAAVTASVRTALINYLDPLAWTGGSTIRRYELVSLVDQVAGVDYVNTLTITGADGNGNYVFTDPRSVPKGTAASITVTTV